MQEEISAAASQRITTDLPKTKPSKILGRMASEKRSVEWNRRNREEKLLSQSRKQQQEFLQHEHVLVRTETVGQETTRDANEQ